MSLRKAEPAARVFLISLLFLLLRSCSLRHSCKANFTSPPLDDSTPGSWQPKFSATLRPGLARWSCNIPRRVVRPNADEGTKLPFGFKPEDIGLPSEAVAQPGSYQALTKINIRADPAVDSQRLEGCIEKSDIFTVSRVKVVGNQIFLKLGTRQGWVFARGISGEWAGKNIVEMLPVQTPEFSLEGAKRDAGNAVEGFKSGVSKFGVDLVDDWKKTFFGQSAEKDSEEKTKKN
eukprot:TRINITY_DN56951_c0_g1_i1.p1 TRINITY_DN56951_c0_g1~~TRINITY_DN56951_c0_g1_i1.p1  ORF type:complete len:233 (+),score=45.86 TRINITY_DN56951_c0_g1_i1:62-760(+)